MFITEPHPQLRWVSRLILGTRIYVKNWELLKLNNPIFSDIQNHWAQDCIKQLSQRNLISGYPDGSFRPNAPVTRAEFAALLRKAFPNAAPIRNAITFVDVPSNHWANQAIQAVYRAGFLSGYPDRTFKPNQQIPRVQTFVAMVSGLKYSPTKTPSETIKKYFDDGLEIPSYAINAIASATERYLVVNYPNVRRFNPNQNATRGEVAALICRALKISGVPLQYIPGMEFIVIGAQFEAADAFSEGMARVKIGEKWGYIDKTGKLVIAPQFDEADAFSDGVALVRQYKAKRE